MLFHVRMEVRLPHDLPRKSADKLQLEEREIVQSLQRAGKWLHLWRVVGQLSNVSIFDVASPEELHDILSALPHFAFTTATITPLCQHPAALRKETALAKPPAYSEPLLNVQFEMRRALASPQRARGH